MRHTTPLETRKRALRAKICVKCFRRPKGSETLEADVPRACEDDCQIFVNLPKLLQIVHRVHERSIGPYDNAIVEQVCNHCEVSNDAGEYCAERKQETCPLARYELEVIEILDKFARHAKAHHT